MRLVKRVADVYRERRLTGVATQTVKKIEHWHRLLTFRPHVIQKTLAGHTFNVAINNLFAQGWVEGRRRWPELEWIKDNLLEEGDFVVDCGANIGFTTIFFAQFVGPSGQVLAFEPFPPNARDIQQNTLLNNLTNVSVQQAALGNCSGNVTLLATSNGIISAGNSDKTISVPMVRLDDVLRDRMPTLLKIDVEGHELEVLKGASRVLESRPKLDIEVHAFLHADRHAYSRAIFDVLGKLKYKLFIQRQVDGEIEPFVMTGQGIDELAGQLLFHIYARPVE